MKAHFDGERLAELRKDRGWDQVELAKQLGVHQQTVSKYENGRQVPEKKVLVSIGEIFNISLDYLFSLIDEEVPYSREGYIPLPPDCPGALREELMEHYALLKLKYDIK